MEPNQPLPEMPAPQPSPLRPWSRETRQWIIIGLVLLMVWFFYQVSEIVPTIVVVLLLAYLLNPLVVFLQRRWQLSRAVAVLLIYVTFLLVVVLASVRLGPVLFRQVRGLVGQLDQILADTSTLLQGVPLLDALGISVSSASLANELRAELATLASLAPRLVIVAASGVLKGVLVLVLSLYVLLEADSIGAGIDRAVPEGYRDEWQRIKSEMERIWSNFLRGQVILALIIGVIVWITLRVLGVPNALLLGLLAGVLEVVPTIGPVIAMIPAVVIALFQGSTHLPVENVTFAIIVVVAYTIIQQTENHVIVPKVIGSSVNLPPVVILIGTLAGASLAGVLGIFLAAPTLATARVVGEFLLRKLFEPLPANENAAG